MSLNHAVYEFEMYDADIMHMMHFTCNTGNDEIIGDEEIERLILRILKMMKMTISMNIINIKVRK